jgi:hypothetical protein
MRELRTDILLVSISSHKWLELGQGYVQFIDCSIYFAAGYSLFGEHGSEATGSLSSGREGYL